MFTHEYTTPTRLEALLELLHECWDRPLAPEEVDRLLQPEPKAGGARPQAEAVRVAAGDLGLTEKGTDGTVRPAVDLTHASPRDALLAALDERVLAAADVEPYFALFYAYVLGRGAAGAEPRGRDEWVTAFLSDVPAARRDRDPFNKDKVTGIHRWLSYLGLGWYDPAGTFQANPYGRVRRRLGVVFGKQRRLSGEGFMAGVAKACPELDAGAIFRDANPGYDPDARECTLGLAHALVDLHLDGVIRLDCPRDASGWSLAACEPAPRFDNAMFVSSRLHGVELL